MTPKEKAQELHRKFMTVEYEYEDCMGGSMEMSNLSWDAAKQCALIAVDEIMPWADDYGSEQVKYYNEVKSEIEKL